MEWIKTKWHNAEYKTKSYILLTAVVTLLFAAVFLFSHIRFYQSGSNIAALTQRTGDNISVNSGGIITVIDACPPFQWMGAPPTITVSGAELPYQVNGAYVVDASLEDTCLRLIQDGFVFDTSYGGTALVSKAKICCLHLSGQMLIAQIDDLGGNDSD